MFTIDRIKRSRSTGTRTLLPQQPTFLGFCGVLGLWLVPVGALAAQPWQQGFFFALQANFVPLLGPANPMTYDPVQFYNSAVALLSGIGFAMLGLRLLPPMSQTMRDRRLLALTLHDLRRLACGRSSLTVAAWDQRNFGRLSAMQGEADLLPAAQLAAGLSLGGEIIRLRRIADRFGLATEFAQSNGGDRERRQRHGDPRTRPCRSGTCRYAARRRRGTISAARTGVEPLHWLFAHAIRQLLRLRRQPDVRETNLLSGRGTKIPDNHATAAAVRAPKGQLPAGAVGTKIVVTGTVVGVDLDAHTISLVDPSGGLVQTFTITDPRRQAALRRVKIGDTLTAIGTEAFAVALDPA